MPGRATLHWCTARTCRRYQKMSYRARARDGSSRLIPDHHVHRKNPTFPCSRDRWPRQPARRVQVFVASLLAKIRLSVSSRLRNRQAMVLQNFSIRRYLDGENPISTHATFVAGNPLPSATHKLYRPAPDDRDGEDAHEPDACVRYAIGIRSGSPCPLCE